MLPAAELNAVCMHAAGTFSSTLTGAGFLTGLQNFGIQAGIQSAVKERWELQKNVLDFRKEIK